MTLEELEVIISANASQFNRQIENVERQVGQMERQTSKATGGMLKSFKWLGGAIVALGIGKIIKDSIMDGMESIESESLFSTSLGALEGQAREWSENLQSSLGLNGYELRKQVGTLYNMTSSMGIASGQAYELSTSLTELANDMASFYNISTEEAFVKLRSGITGEAEPLKALGILVDETTIKQAAYRNGIAKVGAELTQQQKVQARYIAIMEQTKTAQGDMARTIDSPANQLRLLTTQLDLVKINLGQAFMPIAQIVLPMLVNLAKGLVSITSTIGQFMNALFGTSDTGQEDTINQMVGANQDLASSYGDAEKAAKKAQKTLAGFDEINTLNKAESGASNNAGGSVEMPNLGLGKNEGAVNKISDEIKNMVDKLKAIFKDVEKILKKFATNIAPGVQKAISKIVKVAKLWGETFGRVFKDIRKLGQPLVDWFVNDFSLNISNYIGYVGTVIAGLSEIARKQFEGMHDAIYPVVEWFVTKGLPIISDFVNKTIGLFEELFVRAKGIYLKIYDDAIKPVMMLISDITVDILDEIKEFWDKYGAETFKNISTTLNNIVDLFEKFWDEWLKPIIDEGIKVLTDIWNGGLKDMIGELLDFIGKLVNAAMEIYNKFIMPVREMLMDYFGPAFRNIFKSIIQVGGELVSSIIDVARGGLYESLVEL